MSYTNEWYDKYRQQLKEENVRSTHDEMFLSFAQLMNYPDINIDVIDLGSATGEYAKYGYWYRYLGVDLNYKEPLEEKDNRKFITGNYLHNNLTSMCYFQPNTFVSLFSTEIIMDVSRRYDFYEKIFRENASIEAGLVAGFYYADKPHLEYVIEDNFDERERVYQTVEDQRDYTSDVFAEFRTYRRVPSKMFGNQLVEVWKVLLRNLP